MRGDRPPKGRRESRHSRFTPHARGSTRRVAAILYYCIVYPACAGIDPLIFFLGLLVLRLPRMRGDRPHTLHKKGRSLKFTPHARGSTTPSASLTWRGIVYPACAGIDHGCWIFGKDRMGLPRMRGDRPCYINIGSILPLFTPHARGSTPLANHMHSSPLVYPACAGIDLARGC